MSVRFVGFPIKELGRAFGALSTTPEDAVRCFNLLREGYERDSANQAQTAFIEARATLEPELVAHILKTATPTVLSALLKRVAELTEEHQRTLLARKHDKVTEVIRKHGLIGVAPVEVQERWATSDDLAQRMEIILSGDVSDEIAEQSLPGLVKLFNQMVLLTKRQELCQALVRRFGRARAMDVLLESPQIRGMECALFYVAVDASDLVRIIERWAKVHAKMYDRVVNDPEYPDVLAALKIREYHRAETRLSNALTGWNTFGRYLAKSVKRYWPELGVEMSEAFGVGTSMYGLEKEVHVAEKLIAVDPVKKADVAAAICSEGLDPRTRVLNDGSPEEVLAEVEAAMLTPTEYSILLRRDQDPSDEFGIPDLEDLLVERHPRTSLLGEYYKLIVKQGSRTGLTLHHNIGKALRVEDAADVYGVLPLIVSYDPEEVAEYLEDQGVAFGDLVALALQMQGPSAYSTGPSASDLAVILKS